MNYLITDDNGGFPLKADDVRWLANGIIDSFKGFIAGVNPAVFNEGYILYGCNVEDLSPTQWKVNPGFCVLDNEVCYYPGETVNKGTLLAFNLVRQELWDSAGQKSFLNGSTNNTYKVIKAQLVNTTPGGGASFINIASSTTIRPLNEINFFHTLVTKGDWVELPDSAYQGSFIKVASLPFRIKKNGNMLEISGKIGHTAPSVSISGDQYMLLLPVGCRPPEDVFLPVQGAAGGIGWVQIRSDGQVRVRGDIDQAVSFTNVNGPYIARPIPLS